MKYLIPSLAIVSIVSWCVFLLNQQRDEIISLKKQLKEYESNSSKLIISEESCWKEQQYLQGAVKDLMEACQ